MSAQTCGGGRAAGQHPFQPFSLGWRAGHAAMFNTLKPSKSGIGEQWHCWCMAKVQSFNCLRTTRAAANRPLLRQPAFHTRPRQPASEAAPACQQTKGTASRTFLMPSNAACCAALSCSGLEDVAIRCCARRLSAGVSHSVCAATMPPSTRGMVAGAVPAVPHLMTIIARVTARAHSTELRAGKTWRPTSTCAGSSGLFWTWAEREGESKVFRYAPAP